MRKSVIRKKNDVQAQGAWAELYLLGEEIGRGWVAPQSSVEILSEMRR